MSNINQLDIPPEHTRKVRWKPIPSLRSGSEGIEPSSPNHRDCHRMMVKSRRGDLPLVQLPNERGLVDCDLGRTHRFRELASQQQALRLLASSDEVEEIGPLGRRIGLAGEALPMAAKLHDAREEVHHRLNFFDVEMPLTVPELDGAVTAHRVDVAAQVPIDIVGIVHHGLESRIVHGERTAVLILPPLRVEERVEGPVEVAAESGHVHDLGGLEVHGADVDVQAGLQEVGVLRDAAVVQVTDELRHHIRIDDGRRHELDAARAIRNKLPAGRKPDILDSMPLGMRNVSEGVGPPRTVIVVLLHRAVKFQLDTKDPDGLHEAPFSEED